MIRIETWALLAGVAIFALPVAAGAQTQPVAATGAARQANDRALALEDIIVTADRTGTEAVQVGSFRGARPLDTPLTISVVPEQLLLSQQALTILDALRNTPGVTSSQTSPSVYNNLSIRGIPVENRGNYRLNGSLPIINVIDLPLENKSRVEALKGASALYYGFTTPSGIINLTTKRPTADPLFVAEVNANNYGQVQGHIDAGTTVGIVGVRANFVYGSVANGIDNTTGNRSLQSGAFDLKPLDGLTINVDVEHIHKEVTEPTVLQGRITGALLTVVPNIPSLRTNPGSKAFLNVADETNLLGRVAYKLSPAWTVFGEAGLSYATRDRRFSALGNFNPVTGTGVLNVTAADGQQYRNRNFRAEIAGTFATGPLVHELLIGASKNTRQQYSAPAVTFAGTNTAATRANCVALGLPSTCIQSGYVPVPLNAINFVGASGYNPSRDTQIQDGGLYAFDRVKIGGPDGDWVSVLAGVRKSYYKETAQGTSATVIAPLTTFADNPVSLSGGVVIKPVRWISGYATYIEGLESTPAAPIAAANAGATFPATKSKQYEGGIKIEPKRGLLATAAYFDIDRGLTYLTSANIYTQDGRAKYRGFEGSITGNLTPDLSLYASGLLLSAKQGQTADPTLIGNVIENTAKHQWSISSEYKLTRILPGFAVTGGAFYTGRRAINPQNTLFLPGYTLFDVGGSYDFTIKGAEMTARVYAQNVTNKRYFASTGSNYIALGVPPQVKFSLSVKLF